MNSVTTESGTDEELAEQPVGPGVLLRCGRTLLPVHLIGADRVFERRWSMDPSHIAMCLVEVDPPDSDDEDENDCPGCLDCVRYCAECVRMAAESAEQQPDESGE